VRCLLGNGAAPGGLTLERIRAAGIGGSELPPNSALSVTVPGAAALWEDAVRQWGSMGLEQVGRGGRGARAAGGRLYPWRRLDGEGDAGSRAGAPGPPQPSRPPAACRVCRCCSRP
jgi:hypothetical protein